MSKKFTFIPINWKFNIFSYYLFYCNKHRSLANISFFTEADYQASFQHALKTVECDPSYPEGLQFLAFMYLLYGESELADRYLKRALDRDPLNQETLFYQSYYFYRTADYARSESILNSLLERNPQNLPALVTRAYVWFKLNWRIDWW